MAAFLLDAPGGRFDCQLLFCNLISHIRPRRVNLLTADFSVSAHLVVVTGAFFDIGSVLELLSGRALQKLPVAALGSGFPKLVAIDLNAVNIKDC